MCYTHVYLKKDQAYHCARGSRCNRNKVTVAKKTVDTSMCPHEYIATVLSGPSNVSGQSVVVGDSLSGQATGSTGFQVPSPVYNTSEWMQNTSTYLYQYKKLDLSMRNKAYIDKKIMDMNKAGWPKVYEPSEENCPRCLSPLQAPQQHAGVQFSDLLTRDSLTSVTVLVKKCPSCAILFQPSHDCLLNIGDSLLVTLGNIFCVDIPVSYYYVSDIIFLMLGMVHAGSPLSTIADILIADISLRNDRLANLPASKKEWIGRLLYNGNYRIPWFFH